MLEEDDEKEEELEEEESRAREEGEEKQSMVSVRSHPQLSPVPLSRTEVGYLLGDEALGTVAHPGVELDLVDL